MRNHLWMHACPLAPTQETVYGLAGNALNANAVASIYTAKGRPADNPLIVHVSSLRQDQAGTALILHTSVPSMC
eukprot:scaffold12235_cov20-Tisochrysis_lutea.AAC.6